MKKVEMFDNEVWIVARSHHIDRHVQDRPAAEGEVDLEDRHDQDPNHIDDQNHVVGQNHLVGQNHVVAPILNLDQICLYVIDDRY